MRSILVALVISMGLVGTVYARDKSHSAPAEENQCIGAGPQSPRDIDNIAGTNAVIFGATPSINDMNICNVHFHRNAEHKAAAYSTFVKDGSNSGWACKEPAAGRTGKDHVEYNGCQGIAEGDTIEVHWVHTSCDTETKGVKPLGSGLNACLTTICPNPQLRVVAQVFVVQKGGKLKFPDTVPVSHKDPTVVYTGSTTGTSWNNNHCSPLQVTWDVKTTCDTLNIDDFSKWCSKNKYNDNHAHGVRDLVTKESLLSNIPK